jgi:hypothetical protein
MYLTAPLSISLTKKALERDADGCSTTIGKILH